ncbi:MAG: ankyrin repeat protein 50 [Acidobacteriota bacterium]|jgi:ankyrin repeat protein|nr:ankyrin repeat protein 50 [Acidobacteriota bacterium]
MKIVRRAFYLAPSLFCLLLLFGTAHAQELSKTYFFLEVKDTEEQPVADAKVEAFGKERERVFARGATNKDGLLETYIYVGSYPSEQYNVEISKPGYLLYEDIFFSLAYSLYYVPGRSEKSDSYLHNRVVLLRTPVTATERAAFEAERRKYQFLLAAKKGDVASIRQLLQAGVGVNTADAKGMTAIAWAAYVGNVEAIKLLLDAGADVRKKDSPAHESLVAYMNVGMGDCLRSVPMMNKAGLASCDEVARLLIKAGAGVNTRNPFVKPTLHMAFYHYDYVSDETINALMKAGADINAVDSDGSTTLMEAIGYHKEEVAKILLRAGAHVNARDKPGRTALMRAAFSSTLDFVSLLIKSGADVNAADARGQTALVYAADSPYVVVRADVTKALIAAGANVNAADEKGRTTLMLAAQRAPVDMLKALLDGGALINAKDKEGQTALMYAAGKFDYSMIERVKFLLASGADVSIKDDRGRTALMIAKEVGDQAVIKLIEEAELRR